MCKPSDSFIQYSSDILSITSRKFLTLKHLINHKPATIFWAHRLGLKYRAIMNSCNMIKSRSKELQVTNEQQRLFMRKLMMISKKWKIVQQGTMIFAVIGKSGKKDDFKVLLLKDLQNGIKVELSPEMQKLKVLHVSVSCDKIMLPELKIPQNDEFLELEKAEQVLIDAEIIKKIHETIGVSEGC